jgi:ribosomal protein S20
MLKTKKQKFVLVLGGLVMVAVIAGVWLFGTATTASAADNLRTVTQSAMPGLLGEGYLNHGGGWDFPGIKGGDIDYQQLLADALGITVDDLQAAYQTARDAAIDKAVEEGMITQEQADNMKVWGGFGRRGGFGGFDRAPKGVAGSTIDENALLADALGITTDELQTARETANQAAIDQAIAEGLITQEQADAMQARKTLMGYLDRDTLLAKALGMSVEDLQAAYADGETLTTLMSEKGLDAATVREKLQTAYTEALAQAVKDGVITQEQADEMSQDGHGFGMMPGGMGMPFEGCGGGRGFGHDRGGHWDGGAPVAPNTDDSSGTGFRSPSHATLDAGTDA